VGCFSRASLNQVQYINEKLLTLTNSKNGCASSMELSVLDLSELTTGLHQVLHRSMYAGLLKGQSSEIFIPFFEIYR
jgi:hypothetical protein